MLIKRLKRRLKQVNRPQCLKLMYVRRRLKLKLKQLTRLRKKLTGYKKKKYTRKLISRQLTKLTYRENKLYLKNIINNMFVKLEYAVSNLESNSTLTELQLEELVNLLQSSFKKLGKRRSVLLHKTVNDCIF